MMELDEGGSLRDLMKKQSSPFPESTVLSFLEQIVSAIKYCHDTKPKSLIHGNLTPECILLTKEQKVKICDIVLSKIIHPQSNPSLLMMFGQ
jgi:serine/threonine protein kinase